MNNTHPQVVRVMGRWRRHSPYFWEQTQSVAMTMILPPKPEMQRWGLVPCNLEKVVLGNKKKLFSLQWVVKLKNLRKGGADLKLAIGSSGSRTTDKFQSYCRLLHGFVIDQWWMYTAQSTFPNSCIPHGEDVWPGPPPIPTFCVTYNAQRRGQRWARGFALTAPANQGVVSLWAEW